MKKKDILLVIPTYNERENAENIYLKISALKLPLQMLFIDDNSPDGTGDLLENLSMVHPDMTVMRRKGKLGIGSAHLAGINYAYEKAYRTLITMDCDFTHNPDYISQFLDLASDYDIVIGSRFISADSLKDWSPWRKLLTFSGHAVTKIFLRMPYDASGAFRLYRLDKIPQGIFREVRSQGYSFFFESLHCLYCNGFSIKEIPIALPARTSGHSKMNFKETIKGITYLFIYILCKIFRK